jgi:hypothetical protein
MASYRNDPDRAYLVKRLKAMDRLVLAQCLAEVVDEMLAEKIPNQIIMDLWDEVRQQLGVTAEDVRAALH